MPHCWAFTAMRHVLHPSKKQQVVALGQLCWSLWRIEAEAGIRREAVSGYFQCVFRSILLTRFGSSR
jgi:hypothetical protein